MLKPESIRPRVIVYIRKTAPFSYRVREDLIQDLDLLVIEISDPSLGKLLLINLYNEKALDENLKTQKSGQTTINRALLRLQLQLPFIIAGDFNLHHTWWNSTIDTPSTNADRLVEWLNKHDSRLVNKEKATYHRANLVNKSIIDLAFSSRL